MKALKNDPYADMAEAAEDNEIASAWKFERDEEDGIGVKPILAESPENASTMMMKEFNFVKNELGEKPSLDM